MILAKTETMPTEKCIQKKPVTENNLEVVKNAFIVPKGTFNLLTFFLMYCRTWIIDGKYHRPY